MHSNQNTLHCDLKKLVALYGETDVELVPLQAQSRKQDCGCFAIAYSVSLMFGSDPSAL